MKTIIALAFGIIFTAGCGASAMHTRLDNLERENQALRRQNARLHQGSSGQAQLPQEQDVRPTATPSVTPVASPATAPVGRAWVRQPHGQYVCIVDYDAHVSLAARVRFENKVDDTYGMRKSRMDSWVSFTLNGQPVAIVRTTALFRKALETYDVDDEHLEGLSNFLNYLAPSETCYVELGGADNYKVVATLHKNRGSHRAPVLVDAHREMRWSWDIDPHVDELPFIFQRRHF